MKGQSTFKGFAILSAAGLLVKVLSFLYIPFLLAILGKEGYGIYYSAYTIYVFIYVLTNSGVPVAISKLVSELLAVGNHKDALKSFKISRFILLILGTSMTIIMAITASPISRIFKSEEAYLAVLALAPTLLFTSIASAYRGYFQGHANMIPTAVSQIIEQVINTVFTLVFAALFIKYGLAAACAGGTIGTSLGAFVSAVYLLWYYNKTKKNANNTNNSALFVKRYSYKQLVKKITAYSIPITMSVGLIYAGALTDTWNIKSRLLVAGFNKADTNILFGYFGQSIQLMNVPIAIVTSLAAAIIPAISAAIAVKDIKLAKNSINQSLRITLLISIPSAVGLSVLSRPIYEFIKFGDGYKLMMYGGSVLVFLAIVQIQNSILQSCGKLFRVTINMFWGIVFKIIANFLLISIPQINIYGAIIASAIGYIIPISLNSIAIRKYFKTNTNIVYLAFKPVIASTIMAISSGFSYVFLSNALSFISIKYIINSVSVIVALVIGIVTYLYMLILIKGISSEDISFVPARIRKYLPASLQI